MDCMVYFKTKDGKLSSIHADGHEDVSSAFFDVEMYLHEGNEEYIKPMLALLKGGNAV